MHLRKSELRNFNEDVLDERLMPLYIPPSTLEHMFTVHANPRLVKPHTRDATNLATKPQIAEHSSFEGIGENVGGAASGAFSIVWRDIAWRFNR